MRFKHVGVLLGGLSEERDISLLSGRAVAAGLRRSGYDVVEIDAGRDLCQKLSENGIVGVRSGRVAVYVDTRWISNGISENKGEYYPVYLAGTDPERTGRDQEIEISSLCSLHALFGWITG